MSAAAALIIAPPDDLHAAAVAAALKRRRAAPVWIDTAELSRSLRLTCRLPDPAAMLRLADGQQRSLLAFDTVWWRRPRRPDVENAVDDNQRLFVRSEWTHFLDTLEVLLPARWVNRPSAHWLADRKARQLLVAHAVGLRVPRTVASNDAEAVRALAAQGTALIYKRIGNAASPATLTRALLPADLARLDLLHNCPALFQERIAARLDVRVTIMGDSLYAAEIDSQSGDAPLDWRLDHSVPMRPHQLDGQTAARLLALMQRLGLVYGAIDLRLTPQGEYVFLEVNPGGQFMFVELLAGLPLAGHMADFLCSGRGEAGLQHPQKEAAPT